ncbi:MAG: YHS domain-containing (seleno)protein [Pseudomonadota bacterium]
MTVSRASASIAVPLDQRFMVDSVTGFALNGYDPMAYFLTGNAEAGSRGHEVRWAGIAWRFANAANAAAFQDAPMVFAPQFGGYDAVEMSRGRLVESNPEIFVLREGRLYLFFSEIQRRVFLQAADAHIEAAAVTWPQLMRSAPLAVSVVEY